MPSPSLLGRLLRSGDQLRAAAQLAEAPGGTLLTSHTVQSSLGDLFRLQDDIARRVADALSLPLTGGTSSPAPEAPHDARAYELYLRANQLARTYDGLTGARDLYQRCLDLDSRFAPAWAHIGRCHRVIGKYIDGTFDSEGLAEDAFRRALALSPRLSVAHKFYAHLEADIGQATRAIVRSWTRPPARQRSGAVRGARPRLPVRRSVRPIDCRARRGAPARSERSYERRADPPDDGRRRPAPLRRAATSDRRGRRRHPGHRAGSDGTPGRSAAEPHGDAAVITHSALSIVDRVPDGLGRPPFRIGV